MGSGTKRKTRVGLVQITAVNLPSRESDEALSSAGSQGAPRTTTPARQRAALDAQVDVLLGGTRRVFYSVLPYSVGTLQVYAQAHADDPERYEFDTPLYRRHRPDEGAQLLAGADVVGFSVYIWNVRLSLEIAQRLKAISPNTLIVFGGPQTPDRAESFLRDHPFVDLACHGEGERVFLKILENSEARNWDDIPGISFLRKDGTFESHPQAPRIVDLSTVPSPYLSGTFDPLIKRDSMEKWFPIWETNRGCPFQCTFCDWGSAIAGRVYRFDMDRLQAEIEWFADREMEFVYCCDANYGMLPRDLEITDMLVDAKERTGFPWWVWVQSTKNATERSYTVQKRLSDAGMITKSGVAIALQSLDPKTLKAIKRENISTESFLELQRRFTRDNVETYSDLIVGLPGETYDSFADGVGQMITNGQHNRAVFFNCSILPNAEMADPEYMKEHGIVTVPSQMLTNNYTPLTEIDDEVHEYVDTCIATRTMPKEQWVRTRTLGWMAELLHFERVLQIPFVLLHEVYGLTYREMIEAFTEADAAKLPRIAELGDWFRAKARDVQQGGSTFAVSRRWLNMLWPVCQMGLIKIVTEGHLEAFYRESEEALTSLLRRKSIDFDPALVHEVIDLNRTLLKVPFQTGDLLLECSHNIWEFYRSVLTGGDLPLQESSSTYQIDRMGAVSKSHEQWCANLATQQNIKHANLYDIRALQTAKPSAP